MLRIAVPNKGALAEAAREILQEAGYRQRRDSRELVLVDPENQVEFFYLRPRDIAVYVGKGTLDVGLTGRDLFRDAQVEGTAEEIMALGFGRSVFRLAAPVGTFSSESELAGRRIATSYDGLLHATWSAPASTRRWSTSTAPWSPPSSSAWRTRSPTSWRPAALCAPPAWRSSASPSSTRRPC